MDLPATVDGLPEARLVRLDAERAWLRAESPLSEGAAITATVPGPGGVHLRGRAGRAEDLGGCWVAPVDLEPLETAERDALEHFLFERAVPGFLSSIPGGPRVHDAGPHPEGAATGEGYLRLRPELL